MLTPNELLHISEGAEEIAEMLHNEIIKRIVQRIMLRIGRGEEYILTAQDKWQIETLQEAGYLIEDIQSELAKATKLQQKEITEAMEDAGVKTLEYDDKIYREAGLSPVPLFQSPALVRIAQRNYEATMGEWTNFTRTMASQSQQLYISECDKAYNLVSTGAMSYTQAVKEAINNIATEGVRVTYDTGRSDTIETATLRAVRTGISQMSAQIQTKRMEEFDVEKIIISSHLGARPSHQLWQGKIFTIEEMYSTEAGMPAYGTATGLCGINCRHSFGPYFEGMDNPYEQYDSEENREQYEKEQRQRTLERRIRNTKREVMGKKVAVDECKDKNAKFELDLEYQRKSALLAKQTKEYNDYCNENNLRPLSERIQVAKWDRQQAASARGAAQRYENAHSDKSTPQRNILSDVMNYKKQRAYKGEAKEINTELDKICVKESKWSGKIKIGKLFEMGRKEWNCDITLSPNADYATRLHELIHARSISYYDEKTYIEHQKIEEGSVELLTEQICIKKKINFTKTYEEEVKHLIRINRRGKMYVDDYDYAKKLINVDVDKRIEWLINKANKQYKNGVISEKELEGIYDSISKLIGGY